MILRIWLFFSTMGWWPSTEKQFFIFGLETGPHIIIPSGSSERAWISVYVWLVLGGEPLSVGAWLADCGCSINTEWWQSVCISCICVQIHFSVSLLLLLHIESVYCLCAKLWIIPYMCKSVCLCQCGCLSLCKMYTALYVDVCAPPWCLPLGVRIIHKSMCTSGCAHLGWA